MTSLKDKLIDLNTRAEAIETKIDGVSGNHTDMMTQLEQIENFVKDNKEAVENEAVADQETNTAYQALLATVERLETKVNTLQTQNTTLKNKIAGIAGLCVFSGTVVGLIGGLSLSSIKAVIDKYKRS
jgi:chaperonin cofactor prefoldin